MTKQRLLLTLIVILFVVGGVWLWGARSSDPRSNEVSRVRVGYLPSIAAAQMYIAVLNGYFEDEGLDVEIVEIYSAPEVIQALQARAIDIGFGVLPSVVLAREKGVTVRSLVGSTTDSKFTKEHRIIVSTDSPVKSVDDLKGGSIALVAEPTSDGLSLFDFLKARGIDRSDLRFIKTPHPEMIVAVSSGSVDAAAAIEPFITMGLQAGQIRVLDYYYPDARTEVGTYIIHEDWQLSNVDVATRFTRAILRANSWINEDLTRFRDTLPTLHESGIRFRVSEAVAREVALPGYEEYASEEGVQHLVRLLRKYDFIDSEVDPALVLPRQR